MEQEVKTFSVRFDERTKQILLMLLDNGIQQTTQQIAAGDYSDELLQQHEELSQIKRGILYTKPDEPEEVTEEKPKETPEEMYKSQERTQ